MHRSVGVSTHCDTVNTIVCTVRIGTKQEKRREEERPRDMIYSDDVGRAVLTRLSHFEKTRLDPCRSVFGPGRQNNNNNNIIDD